VTAAIKIADLKELCTSTVAASGIGDAASGDGATPADPLDCLSSDDDEDE
jgi:hypothetical protein